MTMYSKGIEIVTASTCKCDLTWKRFAIQDKAYTLIQYDWQVLLRRQI